jgi:hypothetical protein
MAARRPLGKEQVGVLRSMAVPAGRYYAAWHRGCGWQWGSVSGTERLCESLAKQGLVDKSEWRAPAYPGDRTHFQYAINDAGRAALADALAAEKSRGGR